MVFGFITYSTYAASEIVPVQHTGKTKNVASSASQLPVNMAILLLFFLKDPFQF